MGTGKRKKRLGHPGYGAESPSLCAAADLPLIEEPEECLKLELRHPGEVDRVYIGCALSNRGAGLLVTARKGEHATEDGRVLGQEVPVNTEETILDLQRVFESEVSDVALD
jgi:hypothetical protein